MSAVSFEFTDRDDIEKAFEDIKWTGFIRAGKWRKDHANPLLGLKNKLDRSQEELKNADLLANGFEKLLVVLLEPNGSENEPFQSTEDLPAAVQEIDQLLQEASNGFFTWVNTCMLDVRPMRPRNERDQEPQVLRLKNDTTAYWRFYDVVKNLRPSVIVVCQCDSSDAPVTTAQQLCSRIEKAGMVEWQDVCKRPTQIVYGFHPSVYLREDYIYQAVGNTPVDSSMIEHYREVHRNMLRLTFHIAINTLCGRNIEGTGIQQLREDVQYARAMLRENRQRTGGVAAGISRTE